MDPKDNFRSIAPKYMKLFMKDFDASLDDASAVFGNGGYESLGFTKLQEMKPTVKGSRGGWGWFQWTGPRRKQFEAYCEKNNLDLASNDANYKWLFVELTTTEKAALPKLKAAGTLEEKVKVFENAFERAGVKNYAKRIEWAKFAKEVYGTEKEPEPIEEEKPSVVAEEKKPSLLSIIIKLLLRLFFK